MSSANDNIDSLPTISIFCLWLNYLMTFSKPMLNNVGGRRVSPFCSTESTLNKLIIIN